MMRISGYLLLGLRFATAEEAGSGFDYTQVDTGFGTGLSRFVPQ
jgi:hypothetical protein